MPFFERKNNLVEYLTLTSWDDLYMWYGNNVERVNEMWIAISRKSSPNENIMPYVDAVEVALCYGWIDSTNVSYNALHLSRFSPRRANSNWTELNKARCRRLIRLGRMTKYGMALLPSFEKKQMHLSPFLMDKVLNNKLLLERMQSLPPLYVRIRLDNIDFTLTHLRDTEKAQKQLNKFIQYTLQGETYGQWNDFGRLSDDE